MSHSAIKKIFRIFVVLIALSLAHISYAASTVIDVLVVYTKGTTDLYGSDPTTRFNQLIQVSNQIYRDSGVALELRLVKSLLVDYSDDTDATLALNDITYAKDPAFSGIAALRDQVKADMVIFYRPYKISHGSCGIAWIGGSAQGNFSNPEWKKYMYAHVAISSCGDYVTAHELGHNMGLKHSRKQDGVGGTFPYALGYGVENQFTTIMAYQTSFNVDYWEGKLYKFSNPDLLCKGLPCGIDRSDAQNGADARYALNFTGPQIAKFNIGIAANSTLSLTNSTISSVSSVAKSNAASSKSSVTKSVMASSKSASSSAAVVFAKVAGVTQYSRADWKNEVSRGKGLTLEEAKAIAIKNPKISYFFIVKAQMYLGSWGAATGKGVFNAGDVVFFSGRPWYGSARGLADAYEKSR
jgi:peptidyl-Asp metalloendopeptidase